MSRASHLYPADGVTLREVGLRDGLQLVKNFPTTEQKRRWIRSEHAAGVRSFEAGSFLPITRMPQFADVRDIVDDLHRLEGAVSSVLTLNERAVGDALATPVDEITCLVSATEEHSQANMRRSRAEAVDLIRRAVAAAAEAPHRPTVAAGVAMAFGCSIAGEVDAKEVLRLCEDCLDAGVDLIGVADTVGFAGPRQVAELCAELERLCGDTPFLVHLHDTRGMGIANASAALDAGCRILDGSLGGLGGCPFAPGATGNVVFEDLVYLCETKGFPTGISLAALIETRSIVEEAMPDEPLHGALARSGPPPRMNWAA